MEGLIDSLNKDKWQEITADKKSDGYQEYHVNPHAHKKLDNTSFGYMIENDSVDPKKVVLEFALKDPIKAASLLEIKLNADGTKIVGMDLDGDIVELK
ncbi:uncharacterized protein LOC131942696 [Physella acuta]|uniref:uncharacterized protein LOC131942696 n=1 Tax=Physella acuta TaxID=109671 RepID=UPI0027DDC5AC|nr:uncharacterized protein LOC131942696 [Physella acuta]